LTVAKKLQGSEGRLKAAVRAVGVDVDAVPRFLGQ
jgi:hypothetical protein